MHIILEEIDGHKFTLAQREYAARYGVTGGAGSALCHARARQILDYLIQEELLWPGARDAAGGVLPDGFRCQAHGGLWKLSLDRKNNALPHLLEGVPALGAPESNLGALAAGMNTRSNPVTRWGAATCEMLRAEMAREVTAADVAVALARESRSTHPRLRLRCGKPRMNTLYSSCCCYRDDEACRQTFGKLGAFFHYCVELLHKQGARCAVSGILLRGADCAPDESFYRVSVDAIEPRKGHVRGNVRLICQFLNCGARDKDKTYDHDDDGASQWTRDLFVAYVGESTRASLVRGPDTLPPDRPRNELERPPQASPTHSIFVCDEQT